MEIRTTKSDQKIKRESKAAGEPGEKV